MPWTPPPRSPWAEHLIALGRQLGDDGRSLVELDAEAMLVRAAAATGLDDYGDPWFREPLAIFVDSLAEEAELHLLGRLLARAEILRILRNRLRIEDHWRRAPELGEETIREPLVVTGLGRAGTTFLHELLAEDPANRSPRLWEMWDSVPPPEPTAERDPRIERSEHEAALLAEIAPAFATMQELAGDLPNECIHIFAHQFATDMWLGFYHVPRYMSWLVGSDPAPVYAYHRRVLQLLQSRHRRDRWILKAPSHLHELPALFREYPDARVVISHRDPLRVLGSLTDLMATLQWMRSDRVRYDEIVRSMAFGFAFQLENVTRQREQGIVPDGRILDVRYADLVADPIGTVRGIYRHFDLPFGDELEVRLHARLAARPRGRRGAHDYRFEDTGLDLATERARLAAYQQRYGIPSEV